MSELQRGDLVKPYEGAHTFKGGTLALVLEPRAELPGDIYTTVFWLNGLFQGQASNEYYDTFEKVEAK